MGFMSLQLLLMYMTSMGRPRRSDDCDFTLLLPPPQRTRSSSIPTRRDWWTSCSSSPAGESLQRFCMAGDCNEGAKRCANPARPASLDRGTGQSAPLVLFNDVGADTTGTARRSAGAAILPLGHGDDPGGVRASSERPTINDAVVLDRKADAAGKARRRPAVCFSAANGRPLAVD